MKIELQTARSDASTKAQVVREAWVYLPTYLEETKGVWAPLGQCSLFVRRFRLYATPKGRLSMRMLRDVEHYPDVDAMAEAIRVREMIEAPSDEPPADWHPVENFDDVIARPKQAQRESAKPITESSSDA